MYNNPDYINFGAFTTRKGNDAFRYVWKKGLEDSHSTCGYITKNGHICHYVPHDVDSLNDCESFDSQDLIALAQMLNEVSAMK